MAYITFHTVWSATAHHQWHYHTVTYKCSKCAKIMPTPNSLRLHLYYHQPKPYRCDTQTASQEAHQTKAIPLLSWGCNHKYKHPQDLTRHIETHQQKHYECNFCKKLWRSGYLKDIWLFTKLETYTFVKNVEKDSSTTTSYITIAKGAHKLTVSFLV